MPDDHTPRPDSEITFYEEESDLILGTATPVEDGPATVDLLEAWRARLLAGGREERPTAQEVKDYVGVRDDPAKLEEVQDRLGGARALELMGIEATEERVTHFLSNKAEIQANIAQLREAVGAGKTDIADELTQKLTDLTGANLPGGTPFGTVTLQQVLGTAKPGAKPGGTQHGGEKPPGSSTTPAGSEDPPRDPSPSFAERAASRFENRPAKQQQSDDDPLPLPGRTLQDQYNETGWPDTSPSYVSGSDDGSGDEGSGDEGGGDEGGGDDGGGDDGGGDDGEGLTTGEDAPLDERLAGHVARTGALRDALEPDTRRTTPPMVAKGPDYDPRWAEPLGPSDPVAPADPSAPIALYPEGEGPTSAVAGRGLIRDTGQGIDPGDNPEGPDYGNPLVSDTPSGQPQFVGPRPGDVGPISHGAGAAAGHDTGVAGADSPPPPPQPAPTGLETGAVDVPPAPPGVETGAVAAPPVPPDPVVVAEEVAPAPDVGLPESSAPGGDFADAPDADLDAPDADAAAGEPRLDDDAI